MENKTFERREDIPLQHRWATEDLYASDECWEQELQHMIAQGKEMAGYAGILGRDAKTLPVWPPIRPWSASSPRPSWR